MTGCSSDGREAGSDRSVLCEDMVEEGCGVVFASRYEPKAASLLVGWL